MPRSKPKQKNVIMWDGPPDKPRRRIPPKAQPRPGAKKQSLLKRALNVIKGKKNPSEAAGAAALTEAFHGRNVDKISEFTLSEQYRSELADLGKLIHLWVQLEDGEQTELEFTSKVRVMCTANGRQLHFIGGKQSIDLAELGIADPEKDLVTIGQVNAIEYETSKDFHDFEKTDYTHEFGEEGGTLPVLFYDALNKRLHLAGGTYRVERPGIID